MRNLPGRAYFLVKARQCRAICRKRFRQELQRHRLFQFEIVGAINLAHPTTADQPEDSVATRKNVARNEPGIINRVRVRARSLHLDRRVFGEVCLSGDYSGGQTENIFFDKLGRLLVEGQHLLDLAAQAGILTASLIQVGRSIRGNALERRLKQFIDFTPALGFHRHYPRKSSGTTTPSPASIHAEPSAEKFSAPPQSLRG